MYDYYTIYVDGILDYDGYQGMDFYYFKLLTDSYIELSCNASDNLYGFECAFYN